MTIGVQERLLACLVKTGAIRVRSNENELPFWYTSGVPGPYYINVEKIIGPTIAKNALSEITGILSEGISLTDRTKLIWDTIVDYYHNDSQYGEVIQLLVEYYNSIPHAQALAISGGERRDWFFSVPFAVKLNLPHIFLFKSNDLCVVDVTGIPDARCNNSRVLHVSDIVNTATSYIDRWLPILNKNDITLAETFTVAVRGMPGLNTLKEHGVQTMTPLDLTETVFASAHRRGLINAFSLKEILSYMSSPGAWTRELLAQCGDRMLANYFKLDATQQTRMNSFIQNDPYRLSGEFPRFFAHATIEL